MFSFLLNKEGIFMLTTRIQLYEGDKSNNNVVIFRIEDLSSGDFKTRQFHMHPAYYRHFNNKDGLDRLINAIEKFVGPYNLESIKKHFSNKWYKLNLVIEPARELTSSNQNIHYNNNVLLV